ncbi:dTDP-4-dehydrorhamnose reductase [Anaerolineales bacterium HSG24]|nr:dTDP-4-dehydrorhamnose reductase [Anaerolineales bacterium HSG24]
MIIGQDGQLGSSVHDVLTRQGIMIIPAPLAEYDITDHTIVQKISLQSPDIVINCAAMTDVDGCAEDPDMAFRVNAFGAQNVAHACMRCNADLVYISSNEVFDGQTDTPYTEQSDTNPINPYGSSKLSGEKMSARYQPKMYVVRTAWLYGLGGNNFPTKIMGAADKYGKLRVVADEIGNPTYALDLAEAIVTLMKTREYGTYHFVNEGHCSRYDFAAEILRLTGRGHIPLEPITLADYPRASTVPTFSPIVNTKGADLGITLRPWQDALTEYLQNITN